jgi:hypothetical protein
MKSRRCIDEDVENWPSQVRVVCIVIDGSWRFDFGDARSLARPGASLKWFLRDARCSQAICSFMRTQGRTRKQSWISGSGAGAFAWRNFFYNYRSTDFELFPSDLSKDTDQAHHSRRALLKRMGRTLTLFLTAEWTLLGTRKQEGCGLWHLSGCQSLPFQGNDAKTELERMESASNFLTAALFYPLMSLATHADSAE